MGAAREEVAAAAQGVLIKQGVMVYQLANFETVHGLLDDVRSGRGILAR